VLTMQKKAKQPICADIFNGQHVLVVGLGKTGLSCARFLAERNVSFAIIDSRQKPPGLDEVRNEFPNVDLRLGSFDIEVISRSNILIVSPGIAIKEPALQKAVAEGKELIGDVEVFARCVEKPVIAITGSNGKSTVTTLVGEMAKLAQKKTMVAGNIGLPVLDSIDDDEDTDLYVLELSSFQLETTQSLNAAVSTILNISEDHMDRYESLDDYTNAKISILNGGGIVVVNKDDVYLNEHLPNLSMRKCMFFTLSKPDDDATFGVISHDGRKWLAKGQQALLPVSELKISGSHNIANALAALALGTAIDLPVPAMLEALQRFTGLAHRTQWVAEHNGVNWFNDSKATNVGAAIAAINGMENQNQIILLGGQGKGQDFTPLSDVVEQNAKAVILYGEDAQMISDALADGTNKILVESLLAAVTKANELSKAGDIVLLSPACASFDMFSGYEQRGDAFMQFVSEVTS